MFPLQENLVTLRASCKADSFSLNLAFFGFFAYLFLFILIHNNGRKGTLQGTELQNKYWAKK